MNIAYPERRLSIFHGHFQANCGLSQQTPVRVGQCYTALAAYVNFSGRIFYERRKRRRKEIKGEEMIY